MTTEHVVTMVTLMDITAKDNYSNRITCLVVTIATVGVSICKQPSNKIQTSSNKHYDIFMLVLSIITYIFPHTLKHFKNQNPP